MRKYLFLIIIISFSIIVLCGCGTINRWRSTYPVEVSGTIEVGPKWVEITPPTPLVSRSGTIQVIKIYTEHDVGGDWGKDRKTLKLNDGRNTKIEAYLYGEDEKEYELFINGDARIYISLARNPPNNKQGMIDFPDGKYTKLKIRSELPIKVEKIEWSADYSLDQL